MFLWRKKKCEFIWCNFCKNSAGASVGKAIFVVAGQFPRKSTAGSGRNDFNLSLSLIIYFFFFFFFFFAAAVVVTVWVCPFNYWYWFRLIFSWLVPEFAVWRRFLSRRWFHYRAISVRVSRNSSIDILEPLNIICEPEPKQRSNPIRAIKENPDTWKRKKIGSFKAERRDSWTHFYNRWI